MPAVRSRVPRRPRGLLEDGEEEHAGECAEFPDAGRDAVAGGADPGGDWYVADVNPEGKFPPVRKV
jgi:hypothetical protein